ncbi:MAG: hypothetical protein BGP24_11380 [Lysobacterales bacterium 69-70]|nr:hypothetical protein [Xanthomonadaceae bacterium]ODU30821.1 MAG: hypothetical protein ABS97_21150 [Xanthomonadaceae bacterium SCN 69-320]ODV22149.1 MAG: hypothetical protein ABT27_02525 [Xanthomonadaceae bacterium SCN 69-25]OJY98410.1 MAG: hypothetical protein BGP24_11380 [Xanthomonadales bacterium 69-70]
MTTLDLDHLRQRWSEQGRAIDAQLALDVDAVRRRLTAQTATALTRQRGRRLLSLAFGAAAFFATLVFMRANANDPAYLLLALPLALLLLTVGAVDLREWLTLGRIDFAQPLTALRTECDRLRGRRLQVARAIAQLSVLLWLPLIFVLVKGFVGIDLLRRLPLSVTAINVALGVALVPGIAAVLRWVARRRPDSAALRRFVDEAAGRDWQRASDHLNRQLAFERAVAGDTAEGALRRAAALTLPPPAEELRIAARRRVDAGLVLISALILLSGGFNFRHGGEAAAIVPGVLLHLFAIGWLIAAIVQRDALAAPGSAEPSAWRARLDGATRLRTVLLQSYVVAAPLLSLALLQTLGLGLAGIDLWQSLGPALWLGLGLIAVIAMALLFRRRQGAPAGFAARLVDALSLGSLSRAQRAADAAAGDENLRDAA